MLSPLETVYIMFAAGLIFRNYSDKYSPHVS
ncbi:MAG: hypothetical protein ACI9T7_003857, partial [Oleiphilaceae bacterium]